MRYEHKLQLVKFGISNFKAFGTFTELDISRLTLIAGLNSSGKSSIYQSLLLLAQSERAIFNDREGNRRPMLRLNGDFLNLGVPGDILNDVRNRNISFGMTWTDGTSIKLTYTLGKRNKNFNDNIFVLTEYKIYKYDKGKLDSKICMSFKNKQWKITAKSCLSFKNYQLSEVIIKQVLAEIKAKDNVTVDPFNEVVTFSNISNIDFTPGVLYEFTTDIEDLMKCVKEKYRKYIDLNKIREFISSDRLKSSNLSFTNSVFSTHLQYKINQIDVTYIEPFRGYPRRVYSDEANPNPLSSFVRQANRRVRYKFEDGNVVFGTLKEALNFWVVEYFNLADQVNVKDLVPGIVSEIYLVNGKKNISINNVGFGTSQIIPVIFNILTSDAKITIVDEPEIHLHASVQSKLATFFYQMMMIGKKLLIETHSEYLIDKIIYHNISDSSNDRSASLFWIKKTEVESVIEQVQHDQLGFILNAPDGFLSEKKNLVALLNELRLSKLQ